ncbi:MAG: two-component sensor histidine kinase [Frankiales bacterium]|nr:two-component sensor histidine kinase [Frankiales bacterium]
MNLVRTLREQRVTGGWTGSPRTREPRSGTYDRGVTIAVGVLAFLAGALMSAAIALLYVLRRATPTADEAAVSDRAVRSSILAPRVLGAIDVGVLVVDRDEVVIFTNRAAARLGVVDQDHLTVAALRNLVRDVIDSGEPGSVNIDLPSSRGGPDLLSFLIRAMPLDDGDRVASIVLRFTDITEARRLERVRRDFVANVSHELKTPVGALTLLAEAVQEAADDPEAVQRFAERMQREGSRLGRLVQELIELSRLQGAEALPGEDEVAVLDIVTEAVDRSRLVAEQSGITVVVRVDHGLRVRGNETQLANAVANLVDNAIAYSPEQTRVGVTARQVPEQLGVAASPNTPVADGSRRRWVEIAVTDQGIGIAEPELDRVFERFYRVDPARSRATGGTGLGLAIVKHVASNHGGSVSVWSVVGSGSTFTIRLPLVDNSALPTSFVHTSGAVTAKVEHRSSDLFTSGASGSAEKSPSMERTSP